MNLTQQTLLSLAIAASLSLSAPAFAAKGGPGGGGGGGTTTTLDAAEATHLTFMREEEKLARDVYYTLGNMYQKSSIFQNIASTSEQTHTDTMRDKLAQFNLPDPNPDTNNLPSSLGVFTGADYGAYFTEKFNLLTGWGAQSELDALYVGAFIEELDMHDIVECPTIVMQVKGIPEGGCGLNYTDEAVLINSYTSLLDGSKNHLRSYVGQIEAVTGTPYVAQYLPQATVDEILGR